MSNDALVDFTEKAREVFESALKQAGEKGNGVVSPRFIFLSLALDEDSLASTALRYNGLTFDKVWAIVGVMEDNDLEGNVLTRSGKEVITQAIEEAKVLGHHYVGTDLVLLGVIKDEQLRTALINNGIDPDKIRASVLAEIRPLVREQIVQVPIEFKDDLLLNILAQLDEKTLIRIIDVVSQEIESRKQRQ